MSENNIGNDDYIKCVDDNGHEFKMEMGELICGKCGVQTLNMMFPRPLLPPESE